MIWQPLNLTDVCSTNPSLTACSSFGYVYLNLLVQLYSGSKDKNKQNDHKKPDDIRNEYDFIVVGAGSAGCVVANRLSENPNWKVLLLEAGPEQPDITLVPGLSTAILGSNIAWSYIAEPNSKSCLARPGGRCSLTSGKTMGGSSSINAMVYIRGNKADYDDWASLGNEGWNYEEVLPYFKKSEKNMNIDDLDRRYHGVRGEQYVSKFSYIDKPSFIITEAFHERGLPLTDFNGDQQEGTMQSQDITFSGQRVSANTAFIQPIRYKRKNLTIKTNSEALQILIDESKKAYGIIYSQNGQKLTAYAKKEVIISAGALHSPKLLMLSGIGPKDHLEQLGIPVIQNLAVGENLHDHASFSGLVIALSNKTVTTVNEDAILQEVQEYDEMKIKRGPLSAHGTLSTMAFIKTDPDLIAPDVEYHCRGVYNWREFINDPLTADRALIFPLAFYDSVTPRLCNTKPKSRGVLLLNESNPNGPPVLNPNYYGDESDLIPVLKGIRYVLSLDETKVFKSNGAYFVRERMPACRDYVWGTDEYHTCLAKAYTVSGNHPVGTCKMGPKWDEKAVVDNELRVYGIYGLRVIDASIMPSIVRGNTNAPAIMIGERGVDFVIKYWQNNN